MTLPEKNYQLLLKIIPTLFEIKTAAKLHASGFMPLNVDILKKQPKKLLIALSHYYKHSSGDMIPDPDMVVIVHPEEKTIEAVTYQDCFGFRRVSSEDNFSINSSTREELNLFLNQWLTNINNQGHKIAIDKSQH